MNKCIECHNLYDEHNIVRHMRHHRLCPSCFSDYLKDKGFTKKMRVFAYRNAEDIVASMIKNAKGV